MSFDSHDDSFGSVCFFVLSLAFVSLSSSQSFVPEVDVSALALSALLAWRWPLAITLLSPVLAFPVSTRLVSSRLFLASRLHRKKSKDVRPRAASSLVFVLVCYPCFPLLDRL